MTFPRLTIPWYKLIQLFRRTAVKWWQDDCLEMGAALAYYALFSLCPLVLVILSVFGFWMGSNSYAYNQLVLFAQQALPPATSDIVNETLAYLNQNSVGAGVTGFVLLLIAASGFFSALDRSFARIWNLPLNGTNRRLRGVALQFIKRKLFAFALVLGAAALLLVSLLANFAVGLVFRSLDDVTSQIKMIAIDRVVLLHTLQLTASFLILTLVVMTLFKLLPNTQVYWKDVRMGAILTSFLLLILQNLVSSSVLQIGSQFQSYGVIGSVMVLMLWLYLTSQLFFLGGEFTYIYAQLFGSRKTLRDPARSGAIASS